MRRIDRTGQKFGKWTVLKYGGKNKQIVRCECGNERVVSTHNLRTGKSSKCWDCANRLPTGEANFNSKLSNCIAGAKARGFTWELTKEQARSLFQRPCEYCGIPPLQVWRHTETNGEFLHNGIDRADSAKGYTVDNCVPCCRRCNYMKRSLSVEDFLLHIHRIVEHQQKVEAM